MSPIDGYGNKGAEYDELIQFWLDYWKSEGIEFPKKLDPLLIKRQPDYFLEVDESVFK